MLVNTNPNPDYKSYKSFSFLKYQNVAGKSQISDFKMLHRDDLIEKQN